MECINWPLWSVLLRFPSNISWTNLSCLKSLSPHPLCVCMSSFCEQLDLCCFATSSDCVIHMAKHLLKEF